MATIFVPRSLGGTLILQVSGNLGPPEHIAALSRDNIARATRRDNTVAAFARDDHARAVARDDGASTFIHDSGGATSRG